MSFEAHDMNTIHLGNYEEFFILYMDNELSEAEIKMVDEFLTAHADLRAEFEILMNTKLPLEEFSFDKKDLLAETMKLSSVDEELLLYIDNESPADKKNNIELELASDKDYRLQYQALLQTKLDPSEKITYPNKKELYRRTERAIAFKVWMRVAAAIIIIAVGGMFYLRNSSHNIAVVNPPSFVDVKHPVQQNELKNKPINSGTPSFKNSDEDRLAVSSNKKEINSTRIVNKKEKKEINPIQKNEIVLNTSQERNQTPERPIVKSVQFDKTEKTIALADHKDILNISEVTSPSLERKINEPTVGSKESIASNDHKGSIKGFLRKATRMIEKRTGIDPTNENGELLIGAVAINLK